MVSGHLWHNSNNGGPSDVRQVLAVEAEDHGVLHLVHWRHRVRLLEDAVRRDVTKIREKADV